MNEVAVFSLWPQLCQLEPEGEGRRMYETRPQYACPLENTCRPWRRELRCGWSRAILPHPEGGARKELSVSGVWPPYHVQEGEIRCGQSISPYHVREGEIRESSGVGGAWASYHVQEGEIGVGAGWELSTDPHQQRINPSLPMSRWPSSACATC